MSRKHTCRGSSQNWGPILATPNIRCGNIIHNQNGPIRLRTSPRHAYIHSVCSLGVIESRSSKVLLNMGPKYAPAPVSYVLPTGP